MTRRILLTSALISLACFTSALALRSTAQPTRQDWREYGGHQGTRYSTLTQINRSNVRNLEVAWTYDTGVHEYGWSRQQAIDYLASHTALAHHDIVNEVDRYISWPGQALSYYIGYRTLLDLRREAERELGAAFDQKAFHDRVLGLGAVPLGTLEREIRGFIAEAKAAAAKPAG